MDLLSAARRLSRPFVVGADPSTELPLAARGIVGDGLSAALIAVDGAVDWLCWPHFDSTAVFGRLLDRERGGSMAIRPVARPFEALQAYDPDTNVLESILDVPGQGTLRLLDSMPWADDPRASIHELHRRIDCPNGELEIELIFDPRFDFGRDVPRIEATEHGLMAEGKNGERLALSVSSHLRWQALPSGGMRATLRVSPETRLWCILNWNADLVEHVDAHRPYEHLRVTRRKWREWAARLSYDGPWRHHVLRSALTLKLLMYGPTGAVVAAPTTSLPEWIGGTRNWDYRYTWVRDGAMTIRAANLIGYGVEARDFYHFMRDAVNTHDGLKLMYTIHGGEVPSEIELAHLSGAFGSSPVRIGNGARDQLQLDTTGAIVDAAQLFERFGGILGLKAWHKLAAIISDAEQSWQKPDDGIWEPRSGAQHNVHSKLMNWLAMDRGSQLATSFGRSDLSARWQKAAREIHADICKNAMDPSGKHFVSAYGQTRPDAALLLLSLHGFLPDDDPRLAETVRWVRRELSTGPFLHRYRGHADGVGGEEGAFVLCGFWLAEALALQGRLEEASEVFIAHAEASNHLGLLAEEIDPSNGGLLGNFPQAFSHLGLINAALRIDLALRLRDEGSARAPHLVGSRKRKA